MRQRHIYYTCTILAVIGIGLIYGSSIYLEPKQAKINELQRNWQGQKILLEGNVTDFYTAKGHSFLKLKDSTAEIKVVDFNSERSLETGSTVEVEGRISMHKGKMEIIADEIEVRNGR